MTSDYAFVTGGIAAQTNYFTLTRHGYDTGMMLANAEWYSDIGTSNRTMSLAAYGDAHDFRIRSRVYSMKALSALAKGGDVQVVELSVNQREKWFAATRITHNLLVDRIGEKAVALYDLFMESKPRFGSATD